MTKTLIVSVFAILLFACNDPKETVLIKTGNTAFNHTSELSVYSLPGMQLRVVLKFDKRSKDFAIQLDKDKFYMVDLSYLKNGEKIGKGHFTTMYLPSKSNTIIHLDTIAKGQIFLIKNQSELTKSANRLEEYRYKSSWIQQKEITRLTQLRDKATDTGADNSVIDSLSHTIEVTNYKFNKQFYDGQLEILLREKPSLVTALTLNNFSQEQIWSKLETYKQLMSRLSDSDKKSPYALPVFEKLNKRPLFKAGDRIGSLYGKNPEGENLDIKLLKNSDYTFIDFWASWCGPCIEQMPKLKRIANTTPSSRFQIIGISIDDKREFWLNSLKDINVPWMNFSDMGTQDRNVTTFKLGNVPYNYLVDKKGTIVSVNIEPDSIRRFLAKKVK